MRKLYGDSLRKDAGFVKVMKSVASKNARILESRAGKHAPELKRVAREVKGTFDKVYEETADAVEEFLAKCMCCCDHLHYSFLNEVKQFSASQDL
jgi:phosphatidylethanolamine N-methyltransferase